MSASTDTRERVRAELADPKRVAGLLGLLDGAKSQGAAGLSVRCPSHDDRDASCSVTRGADGTVRVRCFGCELRGDVFTLVGAVRGLDVTRDFTRVLAECAALAGVELGDRRGAPYRHEPSGFGNEAPQRPPEPPNYAPAAEVEAAWSACWRLADDGVDAERSYLSGRALTPDVIDDLDLLRAVPDSGAALPAWARRWRGEGYRLVARVHDASGAARGLRAWRIDGVEPKRKAPKGFGVRGLVLADVGGVAMLRGEYAPKRVVISEGEPDWLTFASRYSDADEDAPAVVALPGAGAWTDDVAARIPSGAIVAIATHHDAAGDGYARHIATSLRGRCALMRTGGAS